MLIMSSAWPDSASLDIVSISDFMKIRSAIL
jgi:hypothetical protein